MGGLVKLFWGGGENSSKDLPVETYAISSVRLATPIVATGVGWIFKQGEWGKGDSHDCLVAGITKILCVKDTLGSCYL